MIRFKHSSNNAMLTCASALLLAFGVVCLADRLDCHPTFHSCGVVFNAEGTPNLRFGAHGLPVFYREKGESEWRQGFPGTVDTNYYLKYRSSLVGLKQDTAYEVLIRDSRGEETARADFRTWAEEVPVARTVVLSAADLKDGRPIVIKEKGTPDGYVRITAEPGLVLTCNPDARCCLCFDQTAYVIAEGLVIRGGNYNAVYLDRCRFTRLVNCDISGWINPGAWTYDARSGRTRNIRTRTPLWNHNGIFINHGESNVIERCHIHNPALSSNAWKYAHPDGPQGIAPEKPANTVIRYNDIVGNDLHWWNDGIAGNHNFDLDGGLNRDCDVYGNYIAFANDDAIELDGGQQNVRCFDNLFETCFMGISVQGCMTGPSFVFHNIVQYLCDEFGTCAGGFKTTDYMNGTYAAAHFYNNTHYRAGFGLRIPPNLYIDATNNIMDDLSYTHSHSGLKHTSNLLRQPSPYQGDYMGVPLFENPGKGLLALKAGSPGVGKGIPVTGLHKEPGDIGAPSDREYPVRPTALSLPLGRRAEFTVRQGKATPAAQSLRVLAKDAPVSFKIINDADNPWVSVTPDSGTLAAGQSVELSIAINPALMTDRIRYHAVLLVREPKGWSRPISVTATTDKTYPPLESCPGVVRFDLGAPFAPLEGGGVELSDDKMVELPYEASEDGPCTLLLKCRAGQPNIAQHDSVLLAVNAMPKMPYVQLNAIDPKKYKLISCGLYPFKKGPNTIRLKAREVIQAQCLYLCPTVTPLEEK